MKSGPTRWPAITPPQPQQCLGHRSNDGIAHASSFYINNADEYRRKLKKRPCQDCRSEAKKTDEELREKLWSKCELWKDLTSSRGSFGRI